MAITIEADEFSRLVREGALHELAQRVRALPTWRVVGVLDALPVDEAAVAFRLLGKSESIEVFDACSPGTQADLITELRHAQVADVFASLDPEQQAWLLDELPAKVAKRIISAFDGDELDAAMSLLGYPEDSVGRRMSPGEFTAVATSSVGDVRAGLQASRSDLDMLCTVPVIAPDRTLVGEVNVLTLMRHGSDELIGDVMTEAHSAFTEDNAEITARRALDRGSLLLSVVDREHRLVGMLPIADAARIDRDAVAEDQARAGATEPLRRSYLATPIRAVARSRIVWLLVLAVSAVLTVGVLELFEATLSQRVALALFIPLLIGIGGNTGSQAATTVTRAIALGDVGLRDVARVALKEVRTGLLLGVLLAALGLVIASLVYGADIGIVIAITLVINCPVAATVGGVTPLIARRVGVDPAVFSTPFIATFCDATGLLVYFSVAVLVLGL